MDTESAPAQIVYAGKWEIRTMPDGMAQFALHYPPSSSNHSGTLEFADLELRREMLDGDEHPVRFEFTRDAGTFVCDGSAGRGTAKGTFRFKPDAEYGGAYTERLSPRDHVVAGMFDLPRAFVQALTQKRPGVTFQELIAVRMAGISASEVVQVLDDFPEADLRKLMMLHRIPREPGTTIDVHALHVDFPHADFDSIFSLAMVGVTHAYVEALRRAEVRDMSADNVAALRASGVDREFVDALALNGPRGLSIDEVLGRFSA